MPRKRLARVFLVLVALLVLVAGAAALAVRFLLSPSNLRATLETQASAVLGHPVHIETAAASLYPRIGLGLTGVTVGDPPAASAARVDVSTGLKPLLRRRVEEANLVISGAKVDPTRLARVASSPGRGPGPSGSPGATATPGTTAAAPGGLTIVSIRTIRLDDLEVQGRGKRSVHVDLKASVAGDRVEIPELELRAGRTRLKGHLTLESLESRVGTFALEGPMLDLDELAEVLAAVMPASPSPATPAGGKPAKPAPGGSGKGAPAPTIASALAKRLDGTLAAKAARLSGLELRGLKAKVRVAGSTVTLDPLTISLYDGTYAGALTLDVSGRSPRVQFRGRLERVDLAALARAMGSSAGASGRLTASLDVRGAGDDMTQALRSARGSGELRIDDGALRGLDVVHTALTFLGAGGARTSGNGFARLTSHLALGDGRITTQDLLVTSPDFDLRGKGGLDVDGRLDVAAEVLLSPALTAVAERSIKELAYAKEAERIVLPLFIRGTVASPSVTVDAGAVARRAAGQAAKQQIEKVKKSLFQKFLGGK